jgi:Ribbon-helix-helix protein, copG family
MEDNELRTITFKVSSEEAEAIDRAVRESGLTRSDYIRQQLLAPQPMVPEPLQKLPETRDPTILLHQILFGLDRLHHGMYIIAETAGVLPPEQLKSIADKTVRDGIDFLSTIDERVARTRRQLAERRPAAPPAAEK